MSIVHKIGTVVNSYLFKKNRSLNWILSIIVGTSANGEMEFYETKTGADGYGGGYGDRAFFATCHYGLNGATKNEYYFDDVKFWEYTVTGISAFNQSFFFIANIAVGGDFQGQSIDNTIFPQKMYIDYIRVYQAGVGTQTPPVANRPLTIVHPASARLVVFDVNGRIIVNLTSKARTMPAGYDVNVLLSRNLSVGAYIVSFSDRGSTQTRKLVTVR